MSPFPALCIQTEELLCCRRIFVVFFHTTGSGYLQFAALTVREFFSGLGVKCTDDCERERDSSRTDFISRPGSSNARRCKCYSCTQLTHSPSFLESTVTVVSSEKMVDFYFRFWEKLLTAGYRTNQKGQVMLGIKMFHGIEPETSSSKNIIRRVFFEVRCKSLWTEQWFQNAGST